MVLPDGRSLWSGTETPLRWLPVLVLAAVALLQGVAWPRVPRPRRLQVGVLFVLAALCCLETASLVALRYPSVGPRYLPDPLRIWRLPPNDQDWGTNGQGFRNVRDCGEKSGPRVLCVGDSWVFGMNVAREESWAGRLEQRTGLEVVNAGCPGYCLYQAYLTLIQPGLDLEPDLLVLSNTRNNPNMAAFQASADEAAPWRRLLYHSSLYLWLRREYEMAALSRAAAEAGRLPEPEPSFAESVLEKMATVCERNGISVVVLVVLQSPGDRKRLEIYRSLAERHGYPLVEVEMAPDRYLEGDPFHPDPEGHRQIAEALAPVVLGACARDPVRAGARALPSSRRPGS